MAILISVFSLGYHGKTIDFERYSPCHRTTVAHFLNKGKWNDDGLEGILKSTVIQFIYKEAQRTGKPVFCIVDDTISSKTRPSSRALYPIEDAYFHQSHLKGKQDYGHQAVAVMLSCNGIVLNYAIIMYDKSKSKVKIVQELANELPVPPVASYFLCDSWYTCGSIMDAFIKKGFYTIGALKTNRIVYPCGIKQKISEFALHIRKTDSNASLVNILALQYPDSGKLSTGVPDVDTGIDWLVYLARYSQQCQAQSHFVVRSRLDIVENTEIMVGPNQSFYCGTLRPDCRPFRTGIFTS